jgi:hypothetical protein
VPHIHQVDIEGFVHCANFSFLKIQIFLEQMGKAPPDFESSKAKSQPLGNQGTLLNFEELGVSATSLPSSFTLMV